MSGHHTNYLSAKQVDFSYDGDAAVLSDVTIDINPGSFLAILGVNGSGKSTLLNCLDNIIKPTSGAVVLGDTPLHELDKTHRAQHIAYVTQHSHATRLNVYDELLLGRKPYIKTSPKEHDYEIVDQVIKEMSLEPYTMRYIDELSGGEYQKVMIARAFVQEPDILLLDEPTNNLDIANQAEVLKAVRSAVATHDMAAVAVLHDINLALRYCDRFCFMKEGRVFAIGSRDIITPELIWEVYGISSDIIEHAGRTIIVALDD